MSGAWHPGPRDGSRKGKEERRSRNRPDRAGIYEYQRTDRRVRTDETERAKRTCEMKRCASNA